MDKKRNNERPKTKLTNNNSLFFHREFHPIDLSRKEIQKELANCFHIDSNKELETLGIRKTTIAYSRTKNIKDILCPTTLYQTRTVNVRTHLPSEHIPQEDDNTERQTMNLANSN